MVALGLCRCMQAFSGCVGGATLRCGAHASRCGGYSYYGAWALGTQGQWLWHTGLAAPEHVGSPWIRDQTHIRCTGRWILIHCTTTEVLIYILLLKNKVENSWI